MNIKKYLKYVMELEQSKYTIDKSISYLNAKQNGLGIKKQYEKPQKPSDGGIFSSIFAIAYMVILLGGIGVPVGIVYGAIKWLYTGAQFGACFKGCVFIFAAIGLIFGIIINLQPDSRKSEYYRNLNTYDRLVSEDKKRVENELNLKKNLELQANSLLEKRREIANTLNKLYDFNIIFPKYRNFIAVTTFYEYFISGRCNTLEGHEGAYNIYENEVRLNAIIIRLDDIIEHLNEIRSNQYELYNAISEGNKIANNIYQQSIKVSDDVDRIVENSAITAYNSRITAMNSEIIKYISLYGK